MNDDGCGDGDAIEILLKQLMPLNVEQIILLKVRNTGLMRYLFRVDD